MSWLVSQSHALASFRKYYDQLINRYQSEDTGMEIIKVLLFSFVMEVNRIYSGRNYKIQVAHQDKLTDAFYACDRIPW